MVDKEIICLLVKKQCSEEKEFVLVMVELNDYIEKELFWFLWYLGKVVLGSCDLSSLNMLFCDYLDSVDV